MRIHFKIIQLLLLLLSLSTGAQTYHFANYGVKDGLAQSNVSGIVQDSAGFFYIATAGGVSRFDGKNFTNYTTEDGLADNNASAIFKDKNNIIWIGHENGGLTRFDGRTFKEIKSKLLPKDKKIYSFFQDSKGSLWIATESKGAIRILNPSNSKSDKFQTNVYSGEDGLSQYVLSVSEDKKGNIWFLTDIGIKILDAGTRHFDFFKPQGMPVGQVSAMYRDHDGNFIIGTLNGSLTKYNISTATFETLLASEELLKLNSGNGSNIIYTIFEDSKNNLWASVLNSGVVRYNKGSKTSTLFNTANGLSVNKIKCICNDDEGNIILGTSGEGLEIFSGEKFVSYTKRNGLSDNQVWAICKDKKGNMWFGTNEGLTVHNPKETPDKAYKAIGVSEGLPSNNVRAIVNDKAGNLWIGTWGGKVIKYDVDNSKMIVVPSLNDIVNNLVSCLMIDSHNRLWIGTLEGIVVYDLGSGAIKTYRTIDGLSDNDVSCLFEQSNGDIWIGTKQKGVTVFNGQSFKKYNRENGFNYNSISSITEDSKKNIWIGTESGGALVFNGKTFTNYKTKNGLVSDFVTLIIADRAGSVWLGTNKGLNKFVAYKSAFASYLGQDGFTGLETKPRAVYIDEENNIWFGTVNGAFKYTPKFDLPVTQEPLTHLLNIKVNLNDVALTDKLNLSYQENSLTFDFFGISLSNPDGVTYKTKLEGYDNDWKSISKQTSEIYSNLPPGHYTYKLMACNGWGVCNSEPLSVSIVITPPFWKTWWFYLTVIVVFVTALFAFIKIRERSLILEKKILEEKVNERTAEVVEKNKELDAKNQDITASIRYAKRIQEAILPPDEFVKKNLPNTFILFKPKDIVSGDFYWMETKNDHVLFAAVDCTGHGVPGAFMSIVGHNLLDRIISEQEITEPAKILDELNKGLGETLRQNDLEDNTVKDGMDITLCSFHQKSGTMQYAGAFNPLWLIRNNELIEFKADKFPIGNSTTAHRNSFANHSIELQKGDTFYIFSDGYCDQFGGPSGKKFKASNLKQVLLKSQHLNMQQQRDLLNETIENWRGTLEQVDDILVIGTRYEG
ncbi:MAG: SpoIIE family protein phosphatase [Bacteroidia bacterium]|nr:SpoIIE family protein phosphatase [Bacteroidia bacterium]